MAVQVEFIAFGMAAEIVVVVEDQNAAVGLLCAIKMRGGEAADAPSDHDQVVFLAGTRGGRPALAVAQRVSVLEGAGMAAAHAGEQGRVVAGSILGGGGARGGAGGG